MKKLLTILLCAVMAGSAFAQWEAVRGPVWYNNPADAVALDDSTVITVTKGIVEKTTDLGETWTELELPITLSANEIDANGDVVVIVYDDAYVYKSVDAGDSFSQIGDTTNFSTDLHQVQVYDANTYFVTGEDGLFMKTVDGGTSWDTTVIDASFDLDGGVAFTSLTNGIAVQDGNDAIYWRTTDGGDTWTELALTWPFGTISKRLYDVSAVIGTNTILMVGYHNLIWISTDGGATFAQSGDMSYGYDRNDGCKAFSATEMVVVTDNSAVLSTDDGGTTWDTISVGSGQSHQANAFNSLTKGMVFAAYEQKFKTVDGETYVPIQEWPAISFWGIGFPGDGNVMISAYGGGELTYSDDGEDFDYPNNFASGTVENIYELKFIDDNNGVLAGGYGLIKTTSDGGVTWSEPIESPMSLASNKHINMLNVEAPGKVFAGGSSGMVMVSEDNGATWTEVYNDGSGIVYDMKIFSNGMAMLGMSTGYFAVSTSTALDSFKVVADYGSMAFRSIDERNGVVIVAGSDDMIYKTTVSELDTLKPVFEVPTADYPYAVAFVSDTEVYAVGEDGMIYKSADAGDTWEVMHTIAELYESDLQHCAFDGEYLWAVGKSGLIMKLDPTSTDTYTFTEEFTDGTPDLTWVENPMGANTGGLNVAVVADSAGLENVGIYTDDGYTGIIYADTGNKLKSFEVSADIYLVKDADLNEALYKGLNIMCDDSDLLYYRFIYRNSSSSDNGILKLQGYNGSWHISKTFYPGVDFDTLSTGFHNFKARVVDSKFWVYIDGEELPGCPYENDAVMTEGYPGIYVYNASNGKVAFDNFMVNVYSFEVETAIVNESVPSDFVLEQNYPNPFNPTTTIEFKIPSAEMVNISLYDITGRKVGELMNEPLNAGTYSVNFNASMLPSGVYLYRVTAGEFNAVKKMTLLK